MSSSPEKRSRLAEEQASDEHRADRADAAPHRVGGPIGIERAASSSSAMLIATDTRKAMGPRHVAEAVDEPEVVVKPTRTSRR
jgi:hypothetical protein